MRGVLPLFIWNIVNTQLFSSTLIKPLTGFSCSVALRGKITRISNYYFAFITNSGCITLFHSDFRRVFLSRLSTSHSSCPL
ncbi:hypothetical protein XENTR_v10021817 [Xenopus tropicalis]|nr:hypothetical protein XENTR_v10021817 [Xenopus tropicalis]